MRRRTAGVASTSDTTRSRDQCCRMTEAAEETDVSHVVPLAEEPWFVKNVMNRYGNNHVSSRPGINDDANTMLLRADLHRSFDKRRFTFLPKRHDTIVTHVFGSESLRDIYHNVELNTTYIAPQYFFARFAWTILPLLRPFLKCGHSRLLLIQGQAQWASPAECSGLVDPPPRSRPASPTKKSRSPTKRSANQMEEDDCASQSPNDDSTPDDLTDDSDRHQTKRARRGRSPTPRQNTNTQPPQSHRPLTPPKSGDNVPSPRSVPFSLSGEFQTDTEAENGEQVVVPRCSSAEIPSDEKSDSTSLALQAKQSWMTPRRLRALASSHIRQERKRSDPDGRWEKEEAWLDSVLRAGGALDASEINRWMFVRGGELDQDFQE